MNEKKSFFDFVETLHTFRPGLVKFRNFRILQLFFSRKFVKKSNVKFENCNFFLKFPLLACPFFEKIFFAETLHICRPE